MPQTALRDNPRGKAHALHHTAPALPQTPASSPVTESGFCVPETERVRLPELEQKLPTIPLALPDRCPKPDEQGITETIQLYKNELGREITREEAATILARSMRFVWALNLHRFNQEPTPQTQHKQA